MDHEDTKDTKTYPIIERNTLCVLLSALCVSVVQDTLWSPGNPVPGDQDQGIRIVAACQRPSDWRANRRCQKLREVEGTPASEVGDLVTTARTGGDDGGVLRHLLDGAHQRLRDAP